MVRASVVKVASYGLCLSFTFSLFHPRLRSLRCEESHLVAKSSLQPTRWQNNVISYQTQTTADWKIFRLFRLALAGFFSTLRATHLFLLFLPPLITSPLLFVFSDPSGWVHVLWRECLVFSLSCGGPAFIKLGQWASTRPDLFGQEMRASLEHFHSQVPPEPWSFTKQTLCEAGFPHLVQNQTPLGSGCIAQVHEGEFHGQRVAVKIRRRWVKQCMEQDMQLLCTLAYVLSVCVPALKCMALFEMAENMAQFQRSQLDLRVEARNLLHFQELFQHHSEIGFPTPLYSSEALLIETLEPGVLLSDFLSQESTATPTIVGNANKRAIGRAGLVSFLEMVLVHNFCHSDMHPGNILVQFCPSSHKFERLVLLDAGLVTRLTLEDQTNFIALFSAVAAGNGALAANLVIDRSRRPDHFLDRPGFIAGMEDIVDQVTRDTFRLDRVFIGHILERVLMLVHRHQVQLEPNFMSLVLSIIVLEGVGRQLDPELDIFKESMPMLLRAQKMYQKAALGTFFARF